MISNYTYLDSIRNLGKGDRKVRRGAGEKCGTWESSFPASLYASTFITEHPFS